MTAQKRRALIQHAIALDAVVVATGVALLARDSPLVILGSFLAAVVAVAWFGREELGLFATGYSVVVLGLFFGDAVDVPALTTLALAGAITSTFVRAVRRVRAPATTVEAEAAAPAPSFAPPSLPFTFVLPLLVVVVYTDVSDTIMRLYHIPSLLQPIIALSAVAVWIGREKFRPAEAMQFGAPIFFAVYAVVMLSTSIWAVDPSVTDGRVTEAVKALFICVLVTSLAASWSALRRGLDAMVIAATFLSAISVVQLTTGRFFTILGGLVEPQSGNIYGELALPRASGPPVNDPNFYGRILLIAVPLAVALGIYEKRWPRRLAYFGAAAIVSAAVLFTYSRGAMLALGVVGVLLLLAMHISPKTIALAAAAGVVLLMLLPSEMAERRLSTLKTLAPGESSARKDTSIEMRKLYALSAWKMFETHPLTGVGAGHFPLQYWRYATRVGSSDYNYSPPGYHAFPHNIYLEVAAETGLPGVIAFFGAIATVFVTLRRAQWRLSRAGQRRQAFVVTGIAIAIAGYLAASIFLHESHLRYFGLCLGFSCAAARLARHEEATPRPAPAA